jgi:anhydro-N-acetylmuramic acid kinase
MKVLGVMTGTSCDGLDAACVDFDSPSAGHDGWKPLWSESLPYPSALRRRVLQAQEPGTRNAIRSWLELHRDLGLWYAASLSKLLKARRPGTRPEVIANHGQTLAHYPGQGLTLQLGDPSIIAQATGLTVVSAFREGDLAAGGQGAPLVPRFHRLLAHKLGSGRPGIAIHNLGGMSNLTYVGPKDRLLAFDTGPGNVWIDAAAVMATRGRLHMDEGGRLARSGQVDERGLRELLKHPYFRRAAPKSTGRDEFPVELFLSKTRAKGADLVATATALTVESIARSYENTILRRRLPLRAIYFCGGGAKNPSLIDRLRLRLPSVVIERVDDQGWDGQMIEAQAFAYCGYLALAGQPLGGEWTGARGYGPPAHVIPGANWNQVAPKLRAIRFPR